MNTRYYEASRDRLKSYLLQRQSSLRTEVKTPCGQWRAGASGNLLVGLIGLRRAMRDGSPSAIAEYSDTLDLMIEWSGEGSSARFIDGLRKQVKDDLEKCCMVCEWLRKSGSYTEEEARIIDHAIVGITYSYTILR
jgi:hypothetical protein